MQNLLENTESLNDTLEKQKAFN